MERGCVQPGCGEVAACPSPFCRGHLVTRAVKARHTWSRAAKLFATVGLLLFVLLPRPWKAWGALPMVLAAASTALFLRASNTIARRD